MKRTHMKDRLFVISQYVLPHHLISARPAARRMPPALGKEHVHQVVRPAFSGRHARGADRGADGLRTFQRLLHPRPEGRRPSAGQHARRDPQPLRRRHQPARQDRAGPHLPAKGHSFSAMELLGGDHERAAPFMGGAFATVYLSPRTTTACICRSAARCGRWSMCRAGSSRSTPSRRRACRSCSRATSGSSACSTPSTAPWRWFW